MEPLDNVPKTFYNHNIVIFYKDAYIHHEKGWFDLDALRGEEPATCGQWLESVVIAHSDRWLWSNWWMDSLTSNVTASPTNQYKWISTTCKYWLPMTNNHGSGSWMSIFGGEATGSQVAVHIKVCSCLFVNLYAWVPMAFRPSVFNIMYTIKQRP